MMKRTATLLGRWIVIWALASEVAALALYKLWPSLLRVLRGSDAAYPFYTNVLWCVPYLFCCWGIFKRRRWGFALTVALALCEFVSGVIFAIVFEHFGRGDIFQLALIVSTALLWPSGDEVRAVSRAA
jgi:uncharacterized membrane protein